MKFEIIYELRTIFGVRLFSTSLLEWYRISPISPLTLLAGEMSWSSTDLTAWTTWALSSPLWPYVWSASSCWSTSLCGKALGVLERYFNHEYFSTTKLYFACMIYKTLTDCLTEYWCKAELTLCLAQWVASTVTLTGGPTQGEGEYQF